MRETARTKSGLQFIQLVLDGAIRKTDPGADFFRREAFTNELRYSEACVIRIGRTGMYFSIE